MIISQKRTCIQMKFIDVLKLTLHMLNKLWDGQSSSTLGFIVGLCA